MNEGALITRDDAKLAVSFTAEAVALKDTALASAGLIGRVADADENAAAVGAQVELQRILGLAEKARKACKEPVLEYGRRIDDAAKAFVEELKQEMTRISTMVGSFAQLEQAKARAAEQARNEELTRLEREKAAAMAKATSHEAADAIAEHFNKKAESVPVIEPVRSEGQRISNDWDVTVSDIHLLYRVHPNCVALEPRISEIKNLLKMGVTLKGVTAKPIVKAGVRVGRQPTAIEV